MCFPGPSAPSLANEHEHACSCSFVSSWVAFGLGLGLGQEGGEAAKHTWLPGHTLLMPGHTYIYNPVSERGCIQSRQCPLCSCPQFIPRGNHYLSSRGIPRGGIRCTGELFGAMV